MVWDLLWSTITQAEHEKFILELPKHKITNTIENKKFSAGGCAGTEKEHNMVLRYLICRSKDCINCPVSYRSRYCPKKKKWYFEVASRMTNTNEDFNDEDYINDVDWKRGISKEAKDKIDHLIFEKDIGTPFKLHMSLTRLHKKNKIASCPSLKQIQNLMYFFLENREEIQTDSKTSSSI